MVTRPARRQRGPSRNAGFPLGRERQCRKFGRSYVTLDVFSPLRMGSLELPNRIVMAPMTRNRVGAGNAPVPLNVEYYRQRAGAGLIVTESTQVSEQGAGYAWTPGIHSAAQIDGWRAVTTAVHAAGGRIFCQLWHGGRI